jgi:hypothetical protein
MRRLFVLHSEESASRNADHPLVPHDHTDFIAVQQQQLRYVLDRGV